MPKRYPIIDTPLTANLSPLNPNRWKYARQPTRKIATYPMKTKHLPPQSMCATSILPEIVILIRAGHLLRKNAQSSMTQVRYWIILA